MFTLVIKDIIAMERDRVKWDSPSSALSSAPAAALDVTESPKDLLEKIKKLESTKPYSKRTEAEKNEIKKLYEKLEKSNEDEYTKLADRNPKTPDEQKIYDLWTASRTRLLQIKNGTAELETLATDKDNNERQAEAMIKGLGSIKNNVGVTALLKSVKEDGLILGDTNMRGLVDYALNGLDRDKYRSNGAMFWGDRTALNIFDKVYNANSETLKPIFEQIQAFYSAGQTTEDWMIALNKGSDETPYSKTGFINYLGEYREGTQYSLKLDKSGRGKVESEDRSFMTLYHPGEIQRELGRLSETDLVSRVQTLVKLGGGNMAGNNPAEIFTSMKKDPTLRAQYIKGLNYVALSNGRADFFHTGKLEAGVNSSQADKIVENIGKVEVQNAIKNKFAKDTEEYIKKIKGDPNLSQAQKDSMEAKMNTVVAAMNKPEQVKSLSVEWAAAATNRRAGVGVSVGTQLDSLLADNVSLSGGLSQEFGGAFGSMIALAFTKGLFTSENAEFGAHYGLALAKGAMPFVGVGGRYEDIIASITATPTGASIYAGLRLGTNRNTVEQIGQIGQIEESKKAIRDLSMQSTINTIDLKSIVKDPALASRMTAELKTILANNQFETTKTPDAKYMVMYSSLSEVMNMEILRLYREKNDNGWVLDQIGLNFGQMCGLAYIMVGGRMERNDFQVEIQQVKTNRKSNLDVAGQNALLKSMGYTGVKKTFDKNDSTTTFTIEHEEWAAKYPIVSNIPDNLKSFVTINDNIVTAKNRNIQLDMQASADGKSMIVNISDIGELKTTVVDDNKDELAGNVEVVNAASFDAVMNKPSARKALSNLFFVNKDGLSKFLAVYKNTSLGYTPKDFMTTIEPTLKALLSSNKGNKDIGSMYAFFFPKKGATPNSDVDRFAAVNKLRTGLMTDFSNSSTAKLEDENLMFTAKGGIDKIYNERKNSTTLKALIAGTGIDIADFDEVFAQKTSEKYRAEYKTAGGVDVSKLIGIVAGWKGNKEAHGFSMVPKGLMSIAVDGDGNAMIAQEKEATKKGIALGLMMKTQPEYMNQIADSLIKQVNNMMNISSATPENITDLLTKGSVTIDGKTITSTATIYKVAFGECMNAPSYALDLGKIEYKGKKKEVVDGSKISGSKIEQITSYRTSFGNKVTGIGLGVGIEEKDKTVNGPDIIRSEIETKIEVRDVQVSPRDIKIETANGVSVMTSGGNKIINPLTNQPYRLVDLTRAQAMALANNQPFNMKQFVSIDTTVSRVIPGIETIRHNPNLDSINGITMAVVFSAIDKDTWNDSRWSSLKNIPAGMNTEDWLRQLIDVGFFDKK